MNKTFPEIVLHHIWQRGLWQGFSQETTDGKPIEILSVGCYNRDAGPDFSSVHLRIDRQEWIGNIEIHIASSDWYHHHHHLDPAYDNIILHIVCQVDKSIYNSKGVEIPQCCLRFPVPQDYLSDFIHTAQQDIIPSHVAECSQFLLNDPQLLSIGWRNCLLRKRLECKEQSILHLLEITHRNWEQAFYISLARNFGFHTNSTPFELLAIQTPLPYLLKHHNSLFQLTAMLLGQSGLLTHATAQSREEQFLLKEYLFLQQKFNLKPIEGHLWKKARMRPPAFPEVRIRQFAQLLYQSEFLFSRLMETQDLHNMVSTLTLHPDSNVAHGTRSFSQPPSLGRSSIDILLINTVLPYQYAYKHAREGIPSTQTLSLMKEIAPEDNRIIRQWKAVGISAENAADTQALLHLYQNYCQPAKCMNCEVGYQIFMQQFTPPHDIKSRVIDTK